MIQSLTPKRQIYNIIGCICKQPSLLLDDKYPLQKEDFSEQFYQLIFGAVNNIVVNNPTISKITAIDIDNALAPYTAAYKVYELNGGMEFVKSAIDNSNLELYHQNHQYLKKMSLLRDFNVNGFDIKDIYDYESTDFATVATQLEKFEILSIDEIIEKITLKLVNIQNKWSVGEGKKSYDAHHEIDNLLSKLKSRKEFGYPFANPYYNAIFRGMQQKKLFIRSAGTGVGKTRMALSDIAQVSSVEIFDIDEMKWFKNPNPLPSTFISTELEIEELQTCLIACISGVNEGVVKSGVYSEEVEHRILKAIETIKKSSINLHYIDDFSIADIENIIQKDILEKNVGHVFFDYIQITPKLARTLQDEFGMPMREDQILVNFASRLKLLADKYSIFLSTSTQLNRGAKEHENRDPSGLRGGSATADKANIGIMCFRANQRDLDKLKHILERGIYEKPNFCHYVYKNRGSKSNVIVWTNMNHGNMKEKVCFVTDMDYELVTDIQPLVVKFKDEDEIENNPFA